ncbi:glycoprotein FP21 precursor, putative [Entamoeba dispar SAW760]|uniref:Glycoprotein FP21, putative n=1 Tax=Entamoeba dispar (strain ATCC PRA-260 / SAW760) TaxID=370354 RepID=B0ECC9_ENTDS|nr:glycoprotein FP21 precursor, putative [Entamoeba dispar SAW760]EDR27811.1 glycoprotein FP21 precursor, putative [Entamoeba dispar SAW760]|eukprot:EDR27811.1 glycoprotein FP21 precursor, putative [Entamoeba dispar SAW760]
MAAQNVIIESCDKTNFTVTEDCAKQSVLVQNLMKERSSADEPIPITSVSKEIMEHIIRWMNYHNEHPHMYNDTPEDRCRLSKLHPWDIQFCDELEKDTLFGVFHGAIFMQIPMLIESCARCVAKHLVGKSPAEMREYLNEADEYTPEELEELKKKFAH